MQNVEIGRCAKAASNASCLAEHRSWGDVAKNGAGAASVLLPLLFSCGGKFPGNIREMVVEDKATPLQGAVRSKVPNRAGDRSHKHIRSFWRTPLLAEREVFE